MNFIKMGLAIFLIGLVIAVGAGYRWHTLDRIETGASLRAALSYTGYYSPETLEASARSADAREDKEKLVPWMISGSILALLGLGMMFAARGTAGPTRTCPKCAETVKAEAVVCRFCGAKLGKVDPNDSNRGRATDDGPNSYRALARAAEEAERKARRK